MMGALAMLAAMAAPPADEGLIPAFFNGERLLEICSGSEKGQCWMYVAGVLDGMFNADSARDQRTLCGGVELSNRRAAELVVDELRKRPDLRPRAAAVAVEIALRPQLACKSGEPAQAPQNPANRETETGQSASTE